MVVSYLNGDIMLPILGLRNSTECRLMIVKGVQSWAA